MQIRREATAEGTLGEFKRALTGLSPATRLFRSVESIENHTMLIRISLIVAIVAGLAIGALNFVVVRDKITTLQTDLANTKATLATTQSELAKTKGDLTRTKTDLAETKKTLETTSAERDKAVDDAAVQTKRAGQLSDELAKTKKDRDDAQADLAAYKISGFTPEQVANLGKTLKQTQDGLAAMQSENKILARKIDRLSYELAKYKGSNIVVYLPATLSGKILVSDPKWDFVVLNIGEEQGVKTDGELLVNRDGKLVAKVIVRSIQKNRAIANVMPGWKLGEVLEGDQVIPAHPASS